MIKGSYQYFIGLSSYQDQIPFVPPLLVESWKQGNINLEEVLERCRMSKSTFYRKVREMQEK